MNSRCLLWPLLALSLLPPVVAGCATDQAADEAAESDEEDLTSLTARGRALKFTGAVYVTQGASDSTILETIRDQTQTAFGPLRNAEVGVNSRELKDLNPATFTKADVQVVDEAGAITTMTRVTYTYTDTAVVPVSMAKKSSLALGVLGKNYQAQSKRILQECTENSQHDRDFEGSIWYVFNPLLSSCKAAMTAEQKAIDEKRAKLPDPKAQLPKAEIDRLYIPLTVSLSGNKTNSGTSYPEYDRLYAGGVKKDTLVIGMVNGLLADWSAGEMHDTIDDDGYTQWFDGLDVIFSSRPGFELTSVEPAEDLSTLTVDGKAYTGLSFKQFMQWERSGSGFPAGTTSTQRRALRVAAGKKLANHWLTFTLPVKASIGGAPERDVKIELVSYFGAGSDSGPHKRAIKNSDVYIYNGHSYIGYGPLDPSRFSPDDFPASYQIMFIDGCVSFNYYEKDYIPLKQGGTQNLDLITNGLEAPSWRSAEALGRFVARLIDGKQASYKELLKAAEWTDALRVVDGELDNKYKPSKTPITLR